MFALLINASILILAAATFNKAGKTDVAELDQVHSFLAPLLGSAIAPTLFGIALLVLRPELDRDGDAVRPDRDGGLPRHPPAGLGAAADHALDRHRAGGRRDHLVRRARAPRKLLILSQVVLEPATAVRDRAAGDVHRRPPQDGRTGRAALGDGAGGADGAP